MFLELESVAKRYISCYIKNTLNITKLSMGKYVTKKPLKAAAIRILNKCTFYQ